MTTGPSLPTTSLCTNLSLRDTWVPQGAQNHMALLHQLLPAHLALQPALSSFFTQSIPLYNASYSLGTEGTPIRKDLSSVYWITVGDYLQ